MIILALLIVGLCLGSFVNALVWRLHEQEKLQSRKKKPSKQELDKLSIATGRSMCPHCHHELAPKDLIPVVSWLYLRGKCRYCGKPIPDTPVAEALVAFLFVISYMYWPYAWQGLGIYLFIAWLVFITGFVALSLYDLKWFTLPDRVVFPLMAFALLQAVVVVLVNHTGLQGILNAVWGVLIASGIFYVLFQVSDGRWIGGGDVKLGVVIGLLVGGPAKALLVLFLASLAGTLVAIPGLASGRMQRTSKLPFGPFLMFGTFIVVLVGGEIIHWYLNSFVL